MKSSKPLGWSEFDIVGHSMGAGIGALYAATRPEKSEALDDARRAWSSEQRRRGDRSEASEALTSRYRHEDRDRLKVFAGEEEAAQRWAQGFSKVSIEAARLLSQRGLESCDGGFRWSADTRLKTRSLSRLTESQVLSLLEASRSVPKTPGRGKPRNVSVCQR